MAASSTTIDTLNILKLLLLGAVFIQWTRRLGDLSSVERIYYTQLALAFIVEYTCAGLSMLHIYNAWLYNFYLPVEFVLLTLFAQRLLRASWSLWLCTVAVLIHLALTVLEFLNGTQGDVLNSKSVIFGWTFLTAIFILLLLRLADSTDSPLHGHPWFWVYLSIIVFSGPAIPYVSMMNRLQDTNEALVGSLFRIVEVLFLLSYSLVLLAGFLLPKTQRAR